MMIVTPNEALRHMIECLSPENQYVAYHALGALEAQLATKCASCPDLGMAKLVERLQSENAELLKQLAAKDKQIASLAKVRGYRVYL